MYNNKQHVAAGIQGYEMIENGYIIVEAFLLIQTSL